MYIGIKKRRWLPLFYVLFEKNSKKKKITKIFYLFIFLYFYLYLKK